MTEEYRDARNYLVGQLRAFMLGPYEGNPNEIIPGGRIISRSDGKKELEITQLPSEFYHLGFLSPAEDNRISDEDDDMEDAPGGPDTGGGDGLMSLANAARQSAIGLTCCIEKQSTSISCRISWGTYVLSQLNITQEDAVEEGGKRTEVRQNTAGEEETQINVEGQTNSSNGQTEEGQTLIWVRKPNEEDLQVYLGELKDGSTRLLADFFGVKIYGLKRVFGGLIYLTISVLNTRRTGFNKYKAAIGQEDPCIYQVKCRLTSDNPVFLPSANTGRRDDEEYWNHELLYRDEGQFAVGHGISAKWEAVEERNRAKVIETAWIPEYEVYKASTEALENPEVLNVGSLAQQGSQVKTLNLLRQMACEYDIWINIQKDKEDGICADFDKDSQANIRESIRDNLNKCRVQLDRILKGIDYLEKSEIAWKSFCMANEAMAMAMRQTRPQATPSWRAFQLAFILLAIPSVSETDHDDRDLLDLIWFPTGGGKTEAYLGLTAYVLFHRYLSRPPEEAGGTAVITRYTLRLLTTQQFERAALTIFCCDILRSRVFPDHPPFSIGMLVGTKVTPNSLSSCSTDLAAGNPDDRMLVPFEKCPYCKTVLNLGCLTCDTQSYILRCPDQKCEFSRQTGMPVHIVDEDIFNKTPSFVVATVDKLAQLAWSPEMSRLLGCHDSGTGPDLIIQDELHLITDALGTMVALYEIAIDFLSGIARDGIRPKIIGSTATIRQADRQSWDLFERRVLQFPPSGVSHDDSFFNKQNRDSNGRLYVGIHAQGKSPKHTLPRIIGTLTQSVPDITNRKVRDQYYTIVGYFNSLRELGATLVLAEDDVPRYIDSMPKRSRARYPRQVKELTSQIPNNKIPAILEEMSVGLDSEDIDREPLDLVLATNMISVGVDVDRLGVMVVSGQPKTTAEYIQATSRVGRPGQSAGLVVTMYNWTRPRDRSHYERFTSYHSAFYRYVEAVSVTPFAPRARERGLPGVLASLIRSLSDRFFKNESAMDYDQNAIELQSARQEIIRRAGSIDSDEQTGTESMLAELLDEWEKQLDKARSQTKDLYWIHWRVGEKNKKRFMLRHSDEDPAGLRTAWRAQLSMRDVDPPANIKLVSS